MPTFQPPTYYLEGHTELPSNITYAIQFGDTKHLYSSQIFLTKGVFIDSKRRSKTIQSIRVHILRLYQAYNLWSDPDSCSRFHLFQCNLVHILNEETWSGRLQSFSSTIWSALLFIFEHSYVSSVGSLTLLMASYSFVPSKLTRKKRAIIGGLHVLAHLTAALVLMLLMELGIEICIRNHLLATSGMPSHIVLPTTLLLLNSYHRFR